VIHHLLLVVTGVVVGIVLGFYLSHVLRALAEEGYWDQRLNGGSR
jgi:type III secretory pathway component EscT